MGVGIGRASSGECEVLRREREAIAERRRWDGALKLAVCSSPCSRSRRVAWDESAWCARSEDVILEGDSSLY